MQNTRFYIVRLLGILLLIGTYFLSDPGEDLPLMHFNPNPSCPSVISKASKSVSKVVVQQNITNPQHNHSGKKNLPTHISFDLMTPHESGYRFAEITRVVYACPLPETYAYLFFEEINPPPPRGC